jgi:hypothetical protein
MCCWHAAAAAAAFLCCLVQHSYADGEVIGQAGDIYDDFCIVAQVRGGST